MSRQRIRLLNERIALLEAYRDHELTTPNPAQAYIDDLELSIVRCNTELKLVKDGGGNVFEVQSVDIGTLVDQTPVAFVNVEEIK